MPGVRKAIIVRPDEGEQFDTAGDRYRYLATRETTDGRYGLLEATVPPGGGPPPHLHRREEEGFYVLEGRLTIHADGERAVVGPGSFVNMPVGCTHWFKNETDRPVRMLVFVAPGGFEGMFRKVGRRVAGADTPIQKPDDAEIQRLISIAPEYGVELKLPTTGHG